MLMLNKYLNPLGTVNVPVWNVSAIHQWGRNTPLLN